MKRRIHAWLLVLTVLGLSACSEKQSDIEASITAVASSLIQRNQIEGKEAETFSLAERMAHHKVPGVSIAYFNDGEIVWARAWGVKDATTGEPLTTETLFQASSLSTPVTSFGMLTMVEDGLLDLDTDINQYLTSWSLAENELMVDGPVTLRLVASHSAGLTVAGFMGYKVGDPIPTTVQVLDGIPPANNEPVLVGIAPARAYRYSGGGYVVMQLLMEDVLGMPFPQLMHERVLGPLGMTNSTFEQPLPADRLDHVATAHDSNGEPVDGRFHVYPEMAAAGLWTTPSDLARLILEVQRAQANETGGILSPELIQQMLTAQITNRGLGFALTQRSDGVTVIRNRGSNQGYCAQLFARMNSDGMVIMTNGANGCALMREILMGAGGIYEWAEWRPRTRKVVDVPATVLASYAGRYQVTDPLNAQVIVKPLDNSVSIEVTDLAGATVYYPESETAFFDLSGESVRFEVADDGRSTAVLFGKVRAARVD